MTHRENVPEGNRAGKGEMKNMKAYKKEKKKYLNSMGGRRLKVRVHMLLLGTLSLGIVIYSVVCTIQMKSKDAKTTKEYVRNYVEQRADMIDMEISSNTAMMTGLAETLTEEKPRYGYRKLPGD